MKLNLKVVVTAEDIKNSKRSNMFKCPIACALNRNDDINTPEVQGDHVWMLYGNYGEVTVDLPEIAREFVAAFDAGEEVQPFEFTFE